MADDNSVEEFLSSTPSPSDLIEVKNNVDTFLDSHIKSGEKIVLITSGGTLVPLEKNTVRFLDNFSTGTRGSISAEEFLSQGYAVIFLYRKSSLFPYTRVLDSHTVFDNFECRPDGTVSLNGSLREPFLAALERYKKIISKNLLLSVTYTSVFDYLHYLRTISKCLSVAGESAMIYLAAAVSDFYIHPQNMSEHKMQSTSSLVLTFQEVPKMVGTLVKNWSPRAFVVSFKLETNEDLLFAKSVKALEKYKHQVVVGNILEKRKHELMIVQSTDMTRKDILLSKEESSRGIPIERKLVEVLASIHSRNIN